MMGAAVLEKICEPNGAISYRVTIRMPNGTSKVENFTRLFDAQKRLKQEEEGTKKNVTSSHYA
jgi:hypothetical protein